MKRRRYCLGTFELQEGPQKYESFRQELMADVVERGWKRRFDQPIPLPRGRQLVTLQDAGN